MLATISLS
jgi:hypothetical protein